MIMICKALEDTTDKVYLENFTIKNNNLVVLHFHDVNQKESGIISHFFNNRFSCLINSKSNETRIFLITKQRININKTKIKIYIDTKNNYIEKPVVVYQTGDKTYIDISPNFKIKYVNGKRINRSVSLSKFIHYLEQLNPTEEDIESITNNNNMLYKKREEINFMTEKDYYGSKVYTIKKFTKYYGKDITEINTDEVLSKLKQSKQGDRNIMFFYAVLYHKIIENMYLEYGIDLGFSEDYKHLLNKVIYEIFSPKEKENIKICEHILSDYKFKKINNISQSIYNYIIKNLQNQAGVSLKLYSYNKNKRLYYYHDFKNPNNKNRFLIVKSDNKTQIFSCDKDISSLMNNHAFIKIYDNKKARYYYIMRVRHNINQIRNVNGVRVYQEKYAVTDKEHSTEIVLHYKDNTEIRINDRGIGYIGYNCLRFLSENINDKIKFRTLNTSKHLFNKRFKEITKDDIKAYIRNNISDLQNLSVSHEYDFLNLLRYLYKISSVKGLEREYIKENLIDKIKKSLYQLETE